MNQAPSSNLRGCPLSRLTFSGEIVEDGREKATYDIDAGDLTVVIPKLHRGEEFQDLDLTTALLSKTSFVTQHPPKPRNLARTSETHDPRPATYLTLDRSKRGKTAAAPLIEVLSSTDSGAAEAGAAEAAVCADDEADDGDDDSIDWEIEQSEDSLQKLMGTESYGFDDSYRDVLGRLQTEIPVSEFVHLGFQENKGLGTGSSSFLILHAVCGRT